MAVFSGFLHFLPSISRQAAADPEAAVQNQSNVSPERQPYRYKNQFGEMYEGSTKGAEPMYLSSTKHIPRKLVVQSNVDKRKPPKSPSRKQASSIEVRGQIPLALRATEWARRLLSSRSRVWLIDFLGRVFILMFLTIPLHGSLFIHFFFFKEKGEMYTTWPGHYWKWPKHAVNRLDMRPETTVKTSAGLSSRIRRLHPRQLVVCEEDVWTVRNLDDEPRRNQPYVFISYTNIHFDTNSSEEGRKALILIAQKLALEAGCSAYWMDFQCRAPVNDPALLTADVNRFCDVVRGSKRVVVILPNGKPETTATWGSRMWTLAEGMLAPGTKVYFRCLDQIKTTSLTKIQMTGTIWTDPEYLEGHLQPSRLLAEHFTGTLSLGRLELFSIAFMALLHRSSRASDSAQPKHGPELSYALMAFLNHRIDVAVESETLFQSLARLSLDNDTDMLLERMLCMLPSHRSQLHFKEELADSTIRGSFASLLGKDEYGTQLWDVEPLCKVVGIGDDPSSIVIDGCRTVPIQWNKFPRLCLETQLSEAGKHKGKWTSIAAEKHAEILVATTSACIGYLFLSFPSIYWLDIGTGTQLLILAAVSHEIAIILLLDMRSLFGGTKVVSPPKLVAFEGTMAIRELETKILGFNRQRLSYEPSSTPFNFCYRHPDERIGTEPPWITNPAKSTPPQLAPGHRLFTLVDTGSLTVSVFQAVDPPTVALLAGLEGGMMRVVLCSWDLHRDCLVKESVVRLSSKLLDKVFLNDWMKFSFR